MSKFGEIIDVTIPVLLDFYADWNEDATAMHPVVLNVAAAVGDKAKVIKINVDKNPELTDALRVKALPTLIIYKNGEMVWRYTGKLEENLLIESLANFI